MVDRLPLAKLSIQIKMCPPAGNMQPVKTKKAHSSNPATLRHPCSLNTPPSPTNKWSAMTRSLRITVMGFNGMTILYGHYYFYQDQILLTHAFPTSMTATTVGDGGKPRGSTELDNESGHNCCMTNAEYPTFAHLILGLDSTQDNMGTGNEQEQAA